MRIFVLATLCALVSCSADADAKPDSGTAQGKPAAAHAPNPARLHPLKAHIAAVVVPLKSGEVARIQEGVLYRKDGFMIGKASADVSKALAALEKALDAQIK